MTKRAGKRTPRAATSATRHEAPLVDLVLYVSAVSQYTQNAIRNCEQLLSRFDRKQVRFEVCDVRECPDRAAAEGVCYTPMLVKRSPAPRTCLLGDLSNGAPLLDLLQSCGLDVA